MSVSIWPRAALEAVGLRVALPVLLRALPLDRTLDVLTPRSSHERQRPGPDVLATVERATDVVTRRIPALRTTCMQRALLRYSLLRWRGYEAEFMIGVRPGGPDGFEAHAWIALDGLPVMERAPVDYRPSFVWPRQSAARAATRD